jgi:hypothetical protein
MKTPAEKLRRSIDQTKSRNTLVGRLKIILAGAKRHSIPRGHGDIELTLDDLLSLWNKQSGRCAYTGWELNTHTKSPRLVSLERVDNSIGYVKDNCVLVCWMANNAKGTYNMADFVALCHSVANYKRGELSDFVVDIDSKQTYSPAIQAVTRTLLAIDPINWQVYASYQAEIDSLLAELNA